MSVEPPEPPEPPAPPRCACPMAPSAEVGWCARDALETISEGVIILDVEGRIVFANQAAGALTFFACDQMVGQRLWDLFPAGEHSRFGSEYRRAAAERVAVMFEEFYPAPLNRWYEARAYPSSSGLSIFFRDVTDRRQMEEDLRINLTKYSVLFDSLPLGISVSDAEGAIREVNRTAVDLLVMPREAILAQRIGSGPRRVIHPDGTPLRFEEMPSVRALKEQRPIHSVEMGVAREDGEMIWLAVSAAPIPLEGYGVVITYNDISRRVEAERSELLAHQQTLTQKARLEAVMDALPSGLAIIDHEAGLVRANDAFNRLWGKGEPTRRVDGRVAYAACAQKCGDGACAISGRVIEVERDGAGTAFILNSAAPIAGPDGRISGCVVAVQDITRLMEVERALVRSELALQRSNEDLQAANDALLDYNERLEARVEERTRDLAHRTVQLEGLARDLTRAEERERERVAQVIHDHLQQLLSVARINLGIVLDKADGSPLHKPAADADALIAESLEITRSLTADLYPAILHRSGLPGALRWLGRWYEERFGITVTVDVNQVPAIGDELRTTLFRSVRELLFNVAKHARATEARVAVVTSDASVQIMVIDNGVGFDPARADADGARFGLNSLRERLDLLGAHLDLTSAAGSGTIATITAPLAAPPRPPRPATARRRHA